jgi:hypothetical protein
VLLEEEEEPPPPSSLSSRAGSRLPLLEEAVVDEGWYKLTRLGWVEV